MMQLHTVSGDDKHLYLYETHPVDPEFSRVVVIDKINEEIVSEGHYIRHKDGKFTVKDSA